MSTNYAALLNTPFQYEDYAVNYEGHVYIGQQTVDDRLNEVFGIFGWEHKSIQTEIDEERHTVSVFGRLSIYDEKHNRWVSREQFGDRIMNIRKDESVPTGQAAENAKKAAVSDSLKKCASWFGLASDLYKGLVIGIKPNYAHAFNRLAIEFNLDISDYGKYKFGIPVLPDSYKPYYNQKGWKGIFFSDFQRVIGKTSGSKIDSNDTSITTTKPISDTTGEGSRAPKRHRIMALSTTRTNQDGTAIFEAKMEDNSYIKVLVPKELGIVASNTIAKGNVYFVTGWLKSKQKILRLAPKNSEIILDTNAARNSNVG
ncbi:hypothetical protein AM501_24010 [Aneurinibacillus migulanus]|uniref:Rad52/Rad22 family DNA repair protein n=1 Tax=Aneurinibacillus migulanus TaxID=47500 RepID=UPI0005B76696|nr:Rad52/Rad22 family DNA repair protein [Aneurinibacillus migulanus]KIV58926.1 hypothetical protein TS64_03970 [Aneurinibacillus migulanus]KPD05842.1 hypothetical protein AM501_24010 [Aneurinibacillus migulanus]